MSIASPAAPLSDVVRLAIEIQDKEKADKGIHKITDALKRTFKDRPRGQDFAHREGRSDLVRTEVSVSEKSQILTKSKIRVEHQAGRITVIEVDRRSATTAESTPDSTTTPADPSSQQQQQLRTTERRTATTTGHKTDDVHAEAKFPRREFARKGKFWKCASEPRWRPG